MINQFTSLPTAGVSCPRPLSLSSPIGTEATSSRRQTAADWTLKSGLYLPSVPPRWAGSGVGAAPPSR